METGATFHWLRYRSTCDCEPNNQIHLQWNDKSRIQLQLNTHTVTHTRSLDKAYWVSTNHPPKHTSHNDSDNDTICANVALYLLPFSIVWQTRARSRSRQLTYHSIGSEIDLYGMPPPHTFIYQFKIEIKLFDIRHSAGAPRAHVAFVKHTNAILFKLKWNCGAGTRQYITACGACAV